MQVTFPADFPAPVLSSGNTEGSVASGSDVPEEVIACTSTGETAGAIVPESAFTSPITPDPVISGLPFKKTRIKTEWHKRVLFLDPIEIYKRIKVQPYQRVQTHLTFRDMFPVRADETCACGCNAPISGRRRRWATDDCTKFATTVWAIIDGQAGTISTFVKKYNGSKCSNCGSRQTLKADHIIPVKHGGGGCWLSNFQLLCHACHVAKTNQDFGWKQNKVLPIVPPGKTDAK